MPTNSVVKELSDPGIPGRPTPGRASKSQTENKKPGAERRANSSHLTNLRVAQLISAPVFVSDLVSVIAKLGVYKPLLAPKVLLAVSKYINFILSVKPLLNFF